MASYLSVCIPELSRFYECMEYERTFSKCEEVHDRLHTCVKRVNAMDAERKRLAMSPVFFPPYSMDTRRY